MVGQKSTKAQSVFFHIFSCVLGFIMVYPLLWLLMSSFKSNDTMFHNAWSLIRKSGIFSQTTFPAGRVSRAFRSGGLH